MTERDAAREFRRPEFSIPRRADDIPPEVREAGDRAIQRAFEEKDKLGLLSGRGKSVPQGGLDAEDGLLRRRMFIAAIALLAGHFSDNPGDRPVIVEQIVRLLTCHTEDGLLAPSALDEVGVLESLLRQLARAALAREAVCNAGDGDNYGFHNPIIPNTSNRRKMAE